MAKENKLLKTTMLLTFIIILSKIAGFAREMIMASCFGLSVESDAYSVSYSILSIFTILFGAAIGSTFIPIYTKAQVDQGDEYANRYASNVLNLYIIVALITSFVGYIFAPAICEVMWRNAEGGDLVVRLTRMMMPSLVSWCISGVLVNLLDARKHFVPEQLIGFALSFCVIVACLWQGTIEAVAVATSITALVQVGILAPFLRGQFHWKPVLNLKSEKLRRTFMLALPALISVAFDEINHAADKIFGSDIGIGVVSSLTKSYTLVQTAISVLVIPITTVMFTQLSQYAAKKQMRELRETVVSSIEIVAFITLPIIVMCVMMASDIICVFYQRGQFTAEMTSFTAPVFACYILGIFGFGLRNFLTRVFYSIQKTRIPMFLGMISVSLNIVLDVLWKDTLGAPGLTLATSVASLTGAMLMLIVLRTQVGALGMGKASVQFLKMTLCAVASGFVIWLLLRELPWESDTFMHALMRCIIGILAGIAVYMGLAFALRVRQASKVMDILLGKLRRRGAKPAPASAKKPVTVAEALEEMGTPEEDLEPVEALEAADLNYPGPELVPQPPVYRMARVISPQTVDEPAYGPGTATVTPRRKTQPAESKAIAQRKRVATREEQIARSEEPPAYVGKMRYRSKEVFEKDAAEKYKMSSERTRRRLVAQEEELRSKATTAKQAETKPSGVVRRKDLQPDDGKPKNARKGPRPGTRR